MVRHQKAYGFIRQLQRRTDVFCHIRDIQPKHAVMNPTLTQGVCHVFHGSEWKRYKRGPAASLSTSPGLMEGLCSVIMDKLITAVLPAVHHSRSAGAAAATAEEEDTVADELTNI